MLSKLKIGPKLLLAPGVVLILLIVLSAGAYLGMVRQNQSLEIMVQQRAARIKAADDLVAGANRAHTEIYQLRTWFKAAMDVTIHRYILRRRVEHARQLLLQGDRKLSDVALEAGFAHQSHLAKWMRRELGRSPSELRRSKD